MPLKNHSEKSQGHSNTHTDGYKNDILRIQTGKWHLNKYSEDDFVRAPGHKTITDNRVYKIVLLCIAKQVGASKSGFNKMPVFSIDCRNMVRKGDIASFWAARTEQAQLEFLIITHSQFTAYQP